MSRYVGLLGGSFNPAHQGHIIISELSLKLLNLDEVWWLLSPQNPLKSEAGMAPYEKRLADARRLADRGQIKVSNFEAQNNIRHTADTLKLIKQRYRGYRFVWIMGADNLIQLPQWRRWNEIMQAAPVAVFNRPTYSHKALMSQAAHRYSEYRLSERMSHTLVKHAPPAWLFLWAASETTSASVIRASRQDVTPKRD